jgi:nucleotidyltransferase/DNA polymerase involved in DNA repair
MSEIALVDCDSFFVSCEQLMNPELLNKPVCVASNNDGCVIARSKEAKTLGIKMGMPVFMAKKEFPQGIYLSGNMSLYGEISDRVMATLKEYSPVIEVYSIDEAFIDLTGLRKMYRKNYLEIAKEIRSGVIQKVGVPVSIGVSSTKVLAKLASEKAKKSDGVYRIGFRDITDELKNTEVSQIWGIGKNTTALLNKYGIRTAYQFTLIEEARMTKLLGKKGLELKKELMGESILPVSDKYTAPKSIQKTSSFAKFTSDESYIRNSLNYHAHRACKKLRSLNLKTRTVGLMLRTKDFKVYYQKAQLIQLTDFEFDIQEAIKIIFADIFIPNIIYRSSGIIFEDLAEQTQLSLFSSVQNNIKAEKITSVWDKLEDKYGRGVIYTGTKD